MRSSSIDPVFSLPITEKFSAFAQAGLTYTQSKGAFNGSGFVLVPDANPRKEAFNYKFGAGLQYGFPRSVGMRVEAERYRINDAVGNQGGIDMFPVGLVARFGRHAPASTHAAPPVAAPEPPVAVAEAPVLVIVPVRTPTQEYCTILELEFDNDTDDVRNEDKEKLAVLGTFLAKYPDTTAVIEGHSDSVGTPEHNLKLSQRRAEGVMSDLVEQLHIDPSRPSAMGFGDRRRVAYNTSAEGEKENRRVNIIFTYPQ